MSEPRCDNCGRRELKFVNNYFESHMMAYGHNFEPLKLNADTNGSCPDCGTVTPTWNKDWEGSGKNWCDKCHKTWEPVKTAEGPYKTRETDMGGLVVSGPKIQNVFHKRTDAAIYEATLNCAFAQGRAQSAGEIEALKEEVDRLRGKLSQVRTWLFDKNRADYCDKMLVIVDEALNPPPERKGKLHRPECPTNFGGGCETEMKCAAYRMEESK